MKKEFSAVNIMLRSGWDWDQHHKENNERYRFHTNIPGKMYSSEITAVVYGTQSHLVNSGDYGVTRLEAKYEHNPPHKYDELEDMQQAIIEAEENLLAIGMPFVRGYKFHGGNVEKKKYRNGKLRCIYYDIEGKIKADQQEMRDSFRRLLCGPLSLKSVTANCATYTTSRKV